MYKLFKHNGKRVVWPSDRPFLTRLDVEDHRKLPGCWTFKPAAPGLGLKAHVVGSACAVHNWNRPRRRR